jgi:hypothetical protein
MGLDIYVGTLTRYYCGDWETIIQQVAHKKGLEVQVIRPGRPEDTVSDPTQVRPLVLQWQHLLNEALSEHLEYPIEWDESPDAPYFTDKPSWDCWSDLLLWAAYDEHPELERPAEPVRDWRQDSAYSASNDDDFESQFPHLVRRNLELWLPCDFGFVFSTMSLTGREITVGSAVRLLAELREINEHTWEASPHLLGRWSRTATQAGAPLEVGARFAFGVLLGLVEKSVEFRLPMKLDY